MSNFNFQVLAAVGPKLAIAVEAGRKKIAELNALGALPERASVANAILLALGDWSPAVRGIAIVDGEDRDHLAQALGGILVKFTKAQGTGVTS